MLIDDLRAGLADLDSRALRRRRRSLETQCSPRAVIDGRPMLAFCSNDYLGLASEPLLAEALAEGARLWGSGSGASALVSGHYAVVDELEQALAAFCGTERALAFGTGYLANLGILPAFSGRGDEIFADRLNHASLVDAALLARATLTRYPHCDLDRLEHALAHSTARRKLIVSDAVFSMDGDIAPLPALLELAERHDAWLVVDDAHGFGVLGPGGRGSVAHFGLSSWRLIYMGTLGKAAGVAGAFVAGNADVIEWLMQKARSYVFTTAPPPALSHALLCSLRLIKDGTSRRNHLQALIATLTGHLDLQRWHLLSSRTPIQPIVIGDNQRTLDVAARLQQESIWVPAIRPPTVPVGSARLRISLTAAHTHEDVLRLTDTLNGLAP